MNRAPFFALALGLVAIVFAPGCTPKNNGGMSDAGSGSDSGGGGGDDASSGDAGGGGSIACYIQPQFRCKEYPDPTADELQNLPVECSSDSGDLTQPANCPTAGFQGKCTIGTGKGREVKRVYTGADVAYEQDFCVNTAMGVWSTTF